MMKFDAPAGKPGDLPDGVGIRATCPTRRPSSRASRAACGRPPDRDAHGGGRGARPRRAADLDRAAARPPRAPRRRRCGCWCCRSTGRGSRLPAAVRAAALRPPRRALRARLHRPAGARAAALTAATALTGGKFENLNRLLARRAAARRLRLADRGGRRRGAAAALPRPLRGAVRAARARPGPARPVDAQPCRLARSPAAGRGRSRGARDYVEIGPVTLFSRARGRRS